MAGGEHRRTRRRLDREEAAAAARAAVLANVMPDEELDRIALEVEEAFLANGIKLLDATLLEAATDRNVPVSTYADIRARRITILQFAAKNRGQEVREQYLGPAREEAEAAARAAAGALWDLQHDREKRHNDIGDKIRANVANNVEVLVAAGGVVTTALGVIFPPAGLIAGAVTAGVGAWGAQEAALASKNEEHKEQNRFVLKAALLGATMTRTEAKGILESQGWAEEEQGEMLGETKAPIAVETQAAAPVMAAAPAEPEKETSAATAGLAGIAALALL